MKLFQELTAEKDKEFTAKEITLILRKLGIDEQFKWASKNEQFVKFMLYFVSAYSFGSQMMDTGSYSESLKLIESKFNFDFEVFKTSFDENFDKNYKALIQFYLQIQKTREHELLMVGLTLYKKMLSEVDKDTFGDCLKLHKELQDIEKKLYPDTKLIQVVEESQEKEVFNLRMENSTRPNGNENKTAKKRVPDLA